MSEDRGGLTVTLYRWFWWNPRLNELATNFVETREQGRTAGVNSKAGWRLVRVPLVLPARKVRPNIPTQE